MSAEPAGSREGHIIPQGILECSIKITNEPPTGMKANLHKALDNFTQVTSSNACICVYVCVYVCVRESVCACAQLYLYMYMCIVCCVWICVWLACITVCMYSASHKEREK